jgi:DNA-binding MarR family transcriptional regulator
VSTESAVGPQLGDADTNTVDVTRLRVALARLSRRLRRHELAGLTPTQLAALATIGKSGPMRLGDVAAAEGVAPSTLTRLVMALADSGYVHRLPDPTDARASMLAITPRGTDALERIRAESTLALAESLELLTPAQRAALADALPVLEQLAEAPASDPPESRGRGLPAATRCGGRGRSVGPFGQNDRQAAGQLVALPGHPRQLVFQVDDAADGLQGDALVGHRDHLLDDADLVTGVPALAAGRALRRDHLQVIDPPQEGLLDRQHVRDLPDRVQRDVLVFQR